MDGKISTTIEDLLRGIKHTQILKSLNERCSRSRIHFDCDGKSNEQIIAYEQMIDAKTELDNYYNKRFLSVTM